METGKQNQSLIQQLSSIEKIASALRNQLGRSLRVLDFGSNHGFFTTHLTAAGDHVIAGNYDDINVHLPNSDLVLALNQQSLEFITPQKNNIFLLTGALQVSSRAKRRISLKCYLTGDPSEFRMTGAVRSLASLEMTSRKSLFDLFAYCECILTEMNPILFCSNSYWYADGQLHKFNSWTDFSHELDPGAHANTRRYYFSEQLILKYYQFTKHKAQVNQEELNNEINFLINQSATVPFLPKLIHYKINAQDGWLLRERISGLSFHKVINEGVAYDAASVLKNLLQQLTLLEQQGLYHTDLRTWNLLFNEQSEVRFIDYGSIKRSTTDMLHRKKHVFISFLLLAYEIIHRTAIGVRHFTPAHIHPKYYPEGLRLWLTHLLSIGFGQWSFGLFLKLLNTKEEPRENALRVAEAMKLWLEIVEPGVESPRYRKKHFEKLFIKRLNYEVARGAKFPSRCTMEYMPRLAR